MMLTEFINSNNYKFDKGVSRFNLDKWDLLRLDEWSEQVAYFFKYYTSELKKISGILQEELCPVVIYNNKIHPFEDINSFRKYFEDKLSNIFFDESGNKTDDSVIIGLNEDRSISMIHYNSGYSLYENYDESSLPVLGYMSKTDFYCLLSVSIEERNSNISKERFDLSYFEQIQISKFYFDYNNEYYEAKVSLSAKKCISAYYEKYFKIASIRPEDISF